MKNRIQLLCLLLVFLCSSVHSATLRSDSEMSLLDPAGNYVGGSIFNQGGSYIPGSALFASGNVDFWSSFTLEGIQNLTSSSTGSGSTTDRWLVSYNQLGEQAYSFQSEITLVQTGPNIWETVVLDPDNDGIPGTAIIDGVLAGFTPNFTLITVVPIPPSIVLFGFGLLGLSGIGWYRKSGVQGG